MFQILALSILLSNGMSLLTLNDWSFVTEINRCTSCDSANNIFKSNIFDENNVGINLNVNFDVNDFNSLGHADDMFIANNTEIVESHLQYLGLLLNKYGLQKTFGISRLHKHFDLKNHEKMVIFSNVQANDQQKHTDKSVYYHGKPVVDYEESELYKPYMWRLVDNQWKPIIYFSNPYYGNIMKSFDHFTNFFSDLSSYLTDNKLDNLIGFYWRFDNNLNENIIDPPQLVEITNEKLRTQKYILDGYEKDKINIENERLGSIITHYKFDDKDYCKEFSNTNTMCPLSPVQTSCEYKCYYVTRCVYDKDDHKHYGDTEEVHTDRGHTGVVS